MRLVCSFLPAARSLGPCAGLTLLLVSGCPGTGGEEDTTTATTTAALTGTGSETQVPSDDTTSTTEPSDTSSGCTAGLPGCPCLPGDACMGELVCEGGTCREPGGSESSSGDDTTTGAPAVCANGIAEPGDLCFGAATPFSMGAGSIALAIANFDADPALDLVVANRDASTISIRLGDGSGDFGVQTPFPTGTTPVGVGAGDFDGDGDLDVATVNAGSFDVSILPGTGNGNFGPGASTLLGDMIAPTDLAVTDLEGDGDPDVLVTESTLSLLHVLRRDLGAFLPTASYGVGGGPSAVYLADFSGDDVLDVVTANAAAGSVSLLLGNGFGQLGGASTAMAGAAPADAGAGDFNGDGHTDTIVANPGGFVTIGLGNGLGGLGGQLPFPVEGGPVALVTADLDLDGDTDVAAVGPDAIVHVLRGNAEGSLADGPDIALPAGSDPQDIAAADLNGDGLLDLVTANVATGGVSVILTGA